MVVPRRGAQSRRDVTRLRRTRRASFETSGIPLSRYVTTRSGNLQPPRSALTLRSQHHYLPVQRFHVRHRATHCITTPPNGPSNRKSRANNASRARYATERVSLRLEKRRGSQSIVRSSGNNRYMTDDRSRSRHHLRARHALRRAMCARAMNEQRPARSFDVSDTTIRTAKNRLRMDDIIVAPRSVLLARHCSTESRVRCHLVATGSDVSAAFRTGRAKIEATSILGSIHKYRIRLNSFCFDITSRKTVRQT